MAEEGECTHLYTFVHTLQACHICHHSRISSVFISFIYQSQLHVHSVVVSSTCTCEYMFVCVITAGKKLLMRRGTNMDLHATTAALQNLTSPKASLDEGED